MHWADKIKNKLIETERSEYICAAGITPSGIIHIGNFRDLITAESVKRALEGKKTKLVFFWDNYDRLRKIPSNIPESFSEYLGQPISQIPDPFNCHNSYAEHFQAEFEQVMPELGIDVDFISQTERYQSGYYNAEMKIALNKRKEIADILAKYKTQGMTEKEKQDYYPIQTYCQKCLSSMRTKILGWDGEKIKYSCSCGHEGETDLSHSKLSWKVDWAMRWAKEKICFEPGGWDHSAPGGSYHVSSELSKKIFNYDPPYYQGYGFVGLSGVTKMSSSKGNGIRPIDLLEIYEPELLRWLFTNVLPEKAITFFFGSEVIRQYDAFDRKLEQYPDLPEAEKRAVELAGVKDIPQPRKVPFRQVASFGQIVQGDVDKLAELMNDDPKKLVTRLRKSEKWIEKYVPEMKINVRDKFNQEYYESLSPIEQKEIQTLKNKIKDNWTLDDLTKLIYDIPKKENQTEEEKQQQQRSFFKNVYQLLVDSDTGPRLPTFLLALGQEKINKLLP